MLRSRFAPLGALVAASAAALALAPASHAQFTVTNFQSIDPPFANQNSPYDFRRVSQAYGISNNGIIAGSYTDTDDTVFPTERGYLYQNGTYTTISYPDQQVGDIVELRSANSAGIVTGKVANFVFNDSTQNYDVVETSFIRRADGTYSTPTPTATATINTFAGINDAGLVATQYRDGGLVRGAVYDINTSSFVQFLPDIGTGTSNYIQYVGTNGTIVGNFGTGENPEDVSAYIYQNGAYSTFRIAGSLSTHFNGINAAGIISGRYNDANDISHGLLYNTNTSQYTFFDYPDARETLLRVGSINDSNQIAGSYTDRSGVQHSFTATAVAAPEPGSLALLATGGMVGSTVIVRRRRKNGK